MRVGSLRTFRKALLQFAVSVECLIVLVMDEMQVRGREQRGLEPCTGRSSFSKLIDRAIKLVILVHGPSHFAEDVKSLCALIGSCTWSAPARSGSWSEALRTRQSSVSRN